MQHDRGAPRVRRARFVLAMGLILPFLLATDECPDNSRAYAIATVIQYVDNHTSIEFSERLRIHLYPEVLPRGTVVRPYTLADSPRPEDARICESEKGCRLFFVDTDHWAHFAHQTWLILWDPSAENPIKAVKGRWWPLLNGTPVFDTVEKREGKPGPDGKSTIVFAVTSEWREEATPQIGITVQPVAPSEPSPLGQTLLAPPTAVSTWAVLVAGYADSKDTFITDISGMETVLSGHGLPPRNIFVLSPDYADTWVATLPIDSVRLRSTRANIKDVLENQLPEAVNGSGVACDEAIVFFSSHGAAFGDEGVLYCQGDPPKITEGEFDGWLAAIPCERVTVILEACQSGAFIQPVEAVPPGPIVLPDGSEFHQKERLVVTSSTKNGKSMRDRDTLEGKSDDNPGDLGSETMSGYMEALGTSTTAAAAVQTVTVGEVFAYTTKNDLSHRVGFNDPQIRPTPLSGGVVHNWPRQGTASTLKIVLEHDTPTPPAHAGQLLRCRCNLFSATVSSDGSEPRLATARLYWTTESDPKWNPADQPHFKEVWDSTQMIPAGGFPHSYVIRWSVGRWIDEGAVVTLLAVADSPDAPIRKGDLTLAEFLLDNAQASALKLEAIDPTSCFIFPCGCRTVRCEPPS